jgi:hypothetical protein
VGHGRPKVVEVILHLERSGFRGALGIVDADFEVLERVEPPSPNILATDHHDVECMMLASPALSHLLRNLGDEERIASFQAEKVVPHLLSVGRMVGYLRWASARNKWSLKFEGLSFKAFVREKDFSFEPRLLFEEIRRHQGGRGPAPLVSELEAGIEELMDPSHDVWHVCCGHDLVELLSVGLRRVLGKNNEGDVRGERLEQLLRLAYEEGYFMQTTLAVSILAWQQRNPPFKILPDQRQGLRAPQG